MPHPLDTPPQNEEHPHKDNPCPPQARQPPLCHPHRRTNMTWQTPTATDFRFGFEITMYVAAR